jgi:DNA invertase Pin-like site-specific DNA recombinase
MAKRRTPAVAYLRTSTATNVGADKDSDKRQRTVIAAFAKRAGYSITAEFYDAAVSGADPIEGRPGFAALLDQVEANGARVVIVEDASRFARELMIQEAGIAILAMRSVRLLTAGGDDLTASDDPGRVLMRQMVGAFAQYEKARLVAKLRSGRERKRQKSGKCGGHPALAEIAPDAAALARELARRRKRRPSLRAISAELAKAGHLNVNGQPYNPQSVRAMIQGPQKRRRLSVRSGRR